MPIKREPAPTLRRKAEDGEHVAHLVEQLEVDLCRLRIVFLHVLARARAALQMALREGELERARRTVRQVCASKV